MSIIKRFDHVSIGVWDIEKAKELFLDILGGQELEDKGDDEDEGFSWLTFNLGGKKMEVVTPHNAESGVGRYIESHGEGFHHISIVVENMEEAIAYFESKGLRILASNVDDESWKHCYLHPQDTFGALVQVFEESEKTKALSGE
jgi:methylmalonyl-CoA epimerase